MESPPSEPFPIKTIPTYSRKSPSILTKLRFTSNNPQNTVWKALLNKTVKQRELISLDIRCILRLIKENGKMRKDFRARFSLRCALEASLGRKNVTLLSVMLRYSRKLWCYQFRRNNTERSLFSRILFCFVSINSLKVIRFKLKGHWLAICSNEIKMK